MAKARAPVVTPVSRPNVAVLPWGDLIEDFLDEIGVPFEDFATKMSGGWLFGYIDALRLNGIAATIFCFSDRVERSVQTVHEPTGAAIVRLPAPAAYRRLRRRMRDPYGWNVQEMFGPTPRLLRHGWRLAHHVAPYLATSISGLARAIRRAGCTAILCQEYESPRFDAAAATGALLRIPVFATFQGGSWYRSGLERRLRPYSLRRCSGLIIGSSLEAARVRQRYGISAGKIFHIFNPLDLSMWWPDSRADGRRALGVNDATRVAIWHGRIDIREKGLDLLLEAWQAVCDRADADVVLILIGAGADADRLEREINDRALRRIRWIREYVLDRARIRQYLSAADVYVFPSRREGLPVAPLEAMACGLPVVAASAPGVTDIFEDGEQSGGLIVPVEDADALARHLARALGNPSWSQTLGDRARRRVERAFSLDAVGNQLRQVIQRKERPTAEQ